MKNIEERRSPVLQLIEEPLESERDTLILVIALCRHLVHCLQWSIHRHMSYYTTYTYTAS